MTNADSATDRSRRAPRWDLTAIRAGALLALAIAVPAWTAATWSRDQQNFALNALFTLAAFAGFILGAACSAWIQQLSLPLAHGVVTAGGTYLTVQVVISTYRVVMGTGVNLFSILLFTTSAAIAGLIGGALGGRLRRSGLVPSHQRRLP